MALRQIRGITGIAPKTNYNAIDLAKSATLPALKNYENQQANTEKALGLQEKSIANQEDYNKSSLKMAEETADAQSEDRKRAMWLQGGALGLSALNSMGGLGGVVDKASSAVDSVTGLFSPETVTETTGTIASTASDSGGLWDTVSDIGSGVADAIGTAGSVATDFVGDIASGIGTYASKAWDTISDTASDLASGASNFIDDLFNF